jgi:hypothetical protein
MDNQEPYYVWRGQPLSRFEYFMLRTEIVVDYIVEDAIAQSNYLEEKIVIDKIKKSLYNRDK